MCRIAEKRLMPKNPSNGDIAVWSAAEKKWVAQANSGGGFDPTEDQNITGSYVYEKSTVTSPITITGDRNGSYGMKIENTSNGTSAGSQLLLHNDLGASAQWYSSSSNAGHAYGANTLFLRQVANGAFRFVSDSSNDFYFGPSIYGNSPYAIFSNTLIRFDKNVAIGYNSANARLDVTGDGINPIAIFRDNALNATVKMVNGYLSGGGISLGSYTTNVGGIWNSSVTPNNSNYGLVTTNIYTFLNATTQVHFKINHSDIGLYNSSGFVIGAGATQNGMLTVKGSGGNILSLRNSANVERFYMTDNATSTYININGLYVSNAIQGINMVATNGQYGYAIGTYAFLLSDASGSLILSNTAGTLTSGSFTSLKFGNNTISAPMINVNGTTIEYKLADGSAYTETRASKRYFGTQTLLISPTANGTTYSTAGRGFLFEGQGGQGISLANFVHTSTDATGTVGAMNLSSTFSPTSGTATHNPLRITYTIQTTGTYAGSTTGIYLNATETSITGTTHNLMELLLGGSSRFKVSSNGNLTTNGTSVVINGATFANDALYRTVNNSVIGFYNGGTGTTGILLYGSTHATLANSIYLKAPAGVVIGTTEALANPSAIIQVDCTTKGFLLPRMTTVQGAAIGSPANGLLLYDTTLNMLSIYTSNWEQFVTNKTNMVVGADYEFFFTDASGNPFGTKDLGFKRGSAGVLEITDGSTGCGAIKSCYFQSRDLSGGGLATATRMRFGSTGAVGDGGLTALGIDTQLAVEVDSTILYIPCSTSQFS